MKKISILFLTLCASSALYAMEDNMAIEKATTAHTFAKLPDEVQLAIFKHELSNANKWEKNYVYLGSAAATITNLQRVNKKWRDAFPIHTIARLFNITDTNKDLFLLRAAQIGSPCLVKVAIGLKPNLDFVYTTENKNNPFHGCTPLSIGVRYNNYKSCLYLLDAGASVNKPEEDSPTDMNGYEMMTYTNNYQPIHLAQNKKMLELLLNFKADVNAQDNHGGTALTRAIRVSNASLARVLVKHGGTILENCWDWLHIIAQLEELLALPQPDEIDETELYDQTQVEKTS